MKSIDIDPFVQIIEDLVDSLKQEMVDVSKKLNTLSKKSLTPLDDNLRFKSITNRDVIENLSNEGFITKKIERIFWSRFFQFDSSIPQIRTLQIKLNKTRVANIVLRSINFQTVENHKDHLALLDQLVSAPEYIGKWTNLASYDRMRDIVSSFGEDILYGKRPDLLRRSKNVAAYVLSLHLYFNTSSHEIEENFDTLKNHDLFPFLDPINSNMPNVVTIINNLFLAALLKSYRDFSWQNFVRVPLHLLQLMRLISFGDPRTYPLNINWSNVKDIEPEGFFSWQKSFNEEDIVFFFKELNKVHVERKEFWLQYKSMPDKVILVLDFPTYTNLSRKFKDNEKAMEIINRSFKYNSRASRDQLLIIFFFRDHVIVEGSASGFGCQFFKLEVFKKNFFTSFFIKSDNNIIDQDSFEAFRGSRSGRELMKPHKEGWQTIFQTELASRQILKDKLVNRLKHQEVNVTEKIILSTDPIQFLKENGFEVIDMRLQGGSLWVIDTPSFKKVYNSLATTGVEFVFTDKGSKSTQNRPAWYLKNKM